MNNKLKIIILIIISFILVACKNNSNSNSNKIIINNEKVNVADMEHKHCTRSATADSKVDVKLEYDIYYTDEILNVLKSYESVISEDINQLDTYEDAYKKIYENYKYLDYYDTEIIRSDNKVENITTINYDKLDINKLLEIEGEEDNIIENGKAKVDKWITLAKKFGVTCTKIDE